MQRYSQSGVESQPKKILLSGGLSQIEKKILFDYACLIIDMRNIILSLSLLSKKHR